MAEREYVKQAKEAERLTQRNHGSSINQRQIIAKTPRSDAGTSIKTLQRTAADLNLASYGDILALQGVLGNRAVSNMIQAKLTVGPANDQYEQEADRVATKVIESRPVTSKQSIQRENKEAQSTSGTFLAETITPLVQRFSPQEDMGDGSFEASSEIENKIASRQGGGSPLPDDTRQHMEERFGTDFSGVRVHTDSEAGIINRQLGAQAFTHGSDIYMSEGKYNPSSESGQKLLAHELTHVVQQGGRSFGGRPVQRGLIDWLKNLFKGGKRQTKTAKEEQESTWQPAQVSGATAPAVSGGIGGPVKIGQNRKSATTATPTGPTTSSGPYTSMPPMPTQSTAPPVSQLSQPPATETYVTTPTSTPTGPTTSSGPYTSMPPMPTQSPAPPASLSEPSWTETYSTAPGTPTQTTAGSPYTTMPPMGTQSPAPPVSQLGQPPPTESYGTYQELEFTNPPKSQPAPPQSSAPPVGQPGQPASTESYGTYQELEFTNLPESQQAPTPSTEQTAQNGTYTTPSAQDGVYTTPSVQDGEYTSSPSSQPVPTQSTEPTAQDGAYTTPSVQDGEYTSSPSSQPAPSPAPASAAASVYSDDYIAARLGVQSSPSPTPTSAQSPSSAPSSSFLTIPKEAQFEDETEAGGYWGRQGLKPTYYQPDSQPNPYRLDIQNGKITRGGEALSTIGILPEFQKDKSHRHMFTMSGEGEFFSAGVKEETTRHGRVHHTTMMGGREAAAAGELQVRDGRLEAISDYSGHYLPGTAMTYQVVKNLESQGVDTSATNVELAGKGKGQKALSLSATELLAYQPEMEAALAAARAYREKKPLEGPKREEREKMMRSILSQPEEKIRAAHAKKDSMLQELLQKTASRKKAADQTGPAAAAGKRDLTEFEYKEARMGIANASSPMQGRKTKQQAKDEISELDSFWQAQQKKNQPPSPTVSAPQSVSQPVSTQSSAPSVSQPPSTESYGTYKPLEFTNLPVSQPVTSSSPSLPLSQPAVLSMEEEYPEPLTESLPLTEEELQQAAGTYII